MPAAPRCTGDAAQRTARAATPTRRPARIHDVDAVAQSGDDPEVVRDHHQRGARVGHELLEQFEDLRLDRDVEGRRGLVGDQEPRLARQGHRNQGALAHAAGQLMRVFA